MAASAPIIVPNQRFLNNEPFGRLFDWQLSWLRARDEDRARYSMLEIHRRARKSSTALNLMIRDCHRYPKTRHNIIAPNFEQARRIYFDDPTMLRSALPGRDKVDYRINEQRMIVRFPKTGSVLQFYGGDDPGNLKGIDGETFTFDEWSEAKLECWTEVVRPIVDQYPERKVAFLYTPKPDGVHATQMFDHACMLDEGGELPICGPSTMMRKDWYAYRLCAFKYADDGSIEPLSGIFTRDTLQTTYDSPEMTKAMFDQEYGCARVAEEEFTLITSAGIERLPRDYAKQDRVSAVISCDPAFGGDECVIQCHVGPKIVEDDAIKTRDSDVIMNRLRVMSDAHSVYDFVIDEIGVGRGITDLMGKDRRYRVYRFNSGRKSSNPERWRNLRAEAYWETAEQVRLQKVEYPKDAELRRQLPLASRYKPDGRAIQILAKSEIRKMLGKSPDRADAFVMGRWAINRARPHYLGFPMGAEIWTPYNPKAPEKRVVYNPLTYV